MHYEFADRNDKRGRHSQDGSRKGPEEMSDKLRDHARRIWHAAVAAVRPEPLVRRALAELAEPLRQAPRIWVLGAGKAGGAMADAVERVLADRLDRIAGVVNVPADAVPSLTLPARKIRLHAARPAATNFPTAEGVAGAEEMLRLARNAGPDDIALCLLSGGGSRFCPRRRKGFRSPTSSPSPSCCTSAARRSMR